MSDPAIDELEAQLRDSQFKPWDVEIYLANRHQAKIAELETPENNAGRLWLLTKEIGSLLFAYIGFVAVAAALVVWLLTGEVPIRRIS